MDAAVPDKKTNYDGWLKHYKSKWKTLRANIKRQRIEDEKEQARIEREGGVTRRRRRSDAFGMEAFVESRCGNHRAIDHAHHSG